MKKVLLTAIWLCVLGYGLVVVSEKTHNYALSSYRLVEPPPLTTLDPRMLSIITLGFRGVYDDFINIWAIQFLVDPRVKVYPVDDVFKAIKAVSRQRPKIESIYMLSCFTLALDFKRADLCKEIIIDGMNAFPDSWRLPVTQGFVFAYILKDLPNAAIFYSLAASRTDAPPFLKKLSKNMIEKNELSVSDMQSSLENMFSSSVDSRMGSFLSDMIEKKRDKGNSSGN